MSLADTGSASCCEGAAAAVPGKAGDTYPKIRSEIPPTTPDDNINGFFYSDNHLKLTAAGRKNSLIQKTAEKLIH